MALSFDGVDDISQHTDINAMDGAAALATSFWVQLIGAQAVNDGFWSKGEVFGVGISGSSATELQAHGALASAQRWRTTTVSLVENQWYRLAVNYDGSQTGNANRLQLYLDGVSQTLTFDGAVPASLASTADQVTAGKNITNAEFFKGYLAHLKIWTQAMTAAQLEQELQSFRPISTTGLVLWAPYADGTSARDYSGSGNHGTVTGALTTGGPPQIPRPERFIAQKHRHGGLGLWGHRLLMK